jgi:hypothetical protein
VVLGSGAERLPDSAVRALHLYESMGGMIVFIGGASSPTLADPRWADIAPVVPGEPKTVEHSPGFSDAEGPFTILTCKPPPDAAVRKEGSEVILARRWIGLGRTLFIAFNPFEDPFLRWQRRRKFFENALRPSEFDRAKSFLAQFTAPSGAEYGPSYTSYGYGGTVSVGGTAMPYRYAPDSESADPFSTELPPVEKVLWILVCYFIVIIPVNFLLLKKLKKGELAWVTAPLISVGFAGAFFAAASGLYTAKLSRATQGLLIAMPAGGEALFVGSSQMFFPQGGAYDLRIANMEVVGPSAPAEYGYYYGGAESSQFEGLNAVDDGAIHIRNIDVTNLAFRELSFHQVVSPRRWLDVSVKQSRPENRLIVRNISDKLLPDVQALVGGLTYPVGSLSPGERKEVPLSPSHATHPQPGYQTEQRYGGMDLSMFSEFSKQIVLKVTGLDLPVGPQVGDVVAARQRITVACFTGIRYGASKL